MSTLWRETEKLRLGDGTSSDNLSISKSNSSDTLNALASDSKGDDPSESCDNSERRPSLIKRRLYAAWTRRHRVGKAEDGPTEEHVKGPQGLRLIHPSPEPLVDLIFVHGLKGDSIKTWRKHGDNRNFWPQMWLPAEPGFENVNIHTFGYESDYTSSKPNILSIHDFGLSLLEEMRNAPQLRDNEDRPIILIGHSMGGLVIKKAFILAQDVPQLRSRIASVFFLSTPHRGSDYASTLNNILSASGFLSSRHYLADITTGSVSLQLINDDFGRHAHELPIFSFYETLKMTVGLSSILVVDKASAVLGHGFRNERVQYLDANHRDICKFDGSDDPNYIRVRNALAGAVNDQIKEISSSRQEQTRAQMTALKSYLAVSDSPDEHHVKVSGSCQWIEVREDFQEWRDSATTLPYDAAETKSRNLSMFWVHANPGTGKTVLASHVVSQLQDFRLECAHYYFHAGDKSSSSLSAFLRSIAYQMANANSAIRDKLTKLCQEGSTFDMDDSRTIWTKLFKKGIFQSSVYSPQYWVIDALDECHKYQELFTMLKGEKPNFPLRIFITSRNIPDINRIKNGLADPEMLTSVEIPLAASVGDIQRYIESRIDNLPIDDPSDKQGLAEKIISKSNACFLWVRLVLDELENVYSSESIMKILEGIPEGMKPYYERTIKTMAENTLEKHIAKAVLIWTVASARKLTISELSQALQLDIKTVLPSARTAVEGLCGQLVTVNKDSGVVDLIHPTAREFLMSSAGEFTVSKPKAHERLAMTCLQLLCGNGMRPPRNPRFLTQSRSAPSPLLDYAMMQFSEHIYLASSENGDLLALMDRFFKTNALSWIERVSRTGNLHCLVRASKNLKAYLDRRAKYQSPLSSQVKNIDNWSTDLSRLVTLFGEPLIEDPSSIYFLIPPLCPSSSAIFQQYGKRPDGLSLRGHISAAWDDCVAYVTFGEDYAAAISCGESLIAVGMESGEVNLYNHRSCQKESVIQHKDPVDLIHLSDGFIAVCTTRAVLLKDLTGRTVWERRLRFRCLLLTSFEDCILAVSQHGHLLKWDKETGEEIEDQEYLYQNYDVETKHNGLASRPPQVASISPDMDMLALGYRGGVVCLWDIREGEFVGWARDETGRMAVKLLFNPNPNINLLLVIYTNHGLALYDTWSGDLVNSHSAPNDVGLLSASCSPDGRTLATTDSHGNMHIWDLDSLTVLYHIFSPFPSFRILNFTSDGSSIVDVMDSSMRVWSPAVLVRKNVEDDISISDVALDLAITEGKYESHQATKVAVTCVHPTLGVAYAGKHNGEVVAFATKGDKPSATLYSHARAASITKLAISQNSILASSDVTGSVQVWSLASTALQIDTLKFEIHTSALTTQLCFSAKGDYLLISTTSYDSVYRIADGSNVGTWNFNTSERKTWRWLVLPCRDGEEQQFSLVTNGTLRSYSAEAFPKPMDRAEIRLQYQHPDSSDYEETNIETAAVATSSDTLILEVQYYTGLTSPSIAFLFDIDESRTPAGGESIVLKTLCPTLCRRWKHFVGFNETSRSVVFLDQNSWVSSFDIAQIKNNRYTRHFLAPNDYLSSGFDVSPVKTKDHDVVFCLHEELVSVKNGFKFSITKTLE